MKNRLLFKVNFSVKLSNNIISDDPESKSENKEPRCKLKCQLIKYP